MKVRFNGVLEKKADGCIPCGRKKVSERVMTMSKRYILPSGVTKTFHIGRVEEVSDADGAFLMEYTYTDKSGQEQTVFSEVK